MAVTGPAALAWHGLAAEPADFVDVLVGSACRRQSVGFARLHRTGLEPNVAFRDGAVSYAPPARAVADTVRQLADLAEIRAVVAAGVQRGKVHIWQLAEELARGPSQGSAGLRQALAEVAGGVRSAAEADLVRLIRRARLPMPLLNPRLYVGGKFLASPDAWWPDAGVAVEVDSRQWHLSPADMGADHGPSRPDELARHHRPALLAQPDPVRPASRSRPRSGPRWPPAVRGPSRQSPRCRHDCPLITARTGDNSKKRRARGASAARRVRSADVGGLSEAGARLPVWASYPAT